MTEEDEKAGRDPVLEELKALAFTELERSVAAAVLLRLAAQLWIGEGGNRSSFDELAKSMASVEKGRPGVCKVCSSPLNISEDDARKIFDWMNRHTNATPAGPASPVVPVPASLVGLRAGPPPHTSGPPPHTCEFNTLGFCDVCGVSSPHAPRDPSRGT